ncbi:mandelate racemase/muconate lactonizing enzyme family protein [Fulvivirga sediminis]|uniref:Dipeptide epimerase n=1 Tax=Fulvivirga sediminis TaxID=2803949 RepID=A0A937K2N5_9BACT|nr:dipeptide epimerase [Fulvivirga sediminis]MBL3658002.1 dipeptide epimerase [Fulvivirga sediminis]
MRIKNIEVWRMNLGNTRPYTIAFKTVDDVDSVFVKITLENGEYGVGAGNPSRQVVGESLEDTHATLSEENLEFLIGKDIREIHGVLYEVMVRFPEFPAARAALDIALHDAFTKFLGVPLAQFLGRKFRTLETSVTIGIKDVKATLEEAREYYDMGFRCLKVKTGRDVDEDIERVAKLKEVFVNNVKIRLDANQGYDQAALLKFYKSSKEWNIELIEQPLPVDQLDLLRQLPQEIKEIIALDESLKSPEDAFLLASQPIAGRIFNIKLMKSGGIFPAMQMANIARVAHIDLMWGCNDESAVSVTAALHAALSFSNTRYIDLDGSLDVVTDAVTGGFKIDEGWMSTTEKPGLGVELI